MNRQEVLLHQLQASPRDEKLWGALYERLHAQVYALTFHLCNANTDLAQDVTQDAFLRFIASGAIAKVESDSATVAYLRAIVRNLMHDYYRERLQHPHVSTESMRADDLERALHRVVQHTITDTDLLALPDLRPEDRELLRLRLEGRTVSEVAERLGVTYSAAAVRLHRLRKHLRVTCKEKDAQTVLVGKQGVTA